MHRVLKIVLAIILVAYGNAFWYLLAIDLQSRHLLSTSPVFISLTLLVPILLFAIYISVLPFYSLFIQSKKIWFITIFFSFIGYPFFLHVNFLSILGLFILIVTMYGFLLSYQQILVLYKNKFSPTASLSFALSTVTVILSIVISVNFYSLYRSTLFTNNILLSNQAILTLLVPVIRVYSDDLHITNPQQSFSDYQVSQALITHQTPAQIGKDTLYKLSLTSANSNDSMNGLLLKSLNNSVLNLTVRYKKELPLILSLGLFVIIQTLITTSVFFSLGLTYCLFRLFTATKLLKYKKILLETNTIISSEKDS